MNQQKILRLVLVLFGVIVLFFGGKALWKYFTFSITGVSPTPSSIATLSPEFRIYFTHAPNPSSLKISDKNYAYLDYRIEKNTLIIDLNQPLDKNKTYSISIDSVSDYKGRVITGKQYTFKPKDIAYDKLPEDQRAAFIDEQDKPMPSPETIAFSGMDRLVAHGLSNPQRIDLEWEYFNYKPAAKKISLDIDNAVQTRNTQGPGFIMSIPTTIDGSAYTSVVNYWGLQNVSLRISPAGAAPTLLTQTLHSATPYVTTMLDHRKYPITKKLPYASPDGFLITFGKINGSSEPTIVVTYYTPEAKDRAAQWLQENNTKQDSVYTYYDFKQQIN